LRYIKEEVEILETLPRNMPKLKAVLVDFDGTISTLRYGWENVMGPLRRKAVCRK